MIDPQQASTAWKQLVEMCNKIQDPMLKKSYLAAFKQRAIEEWGFCPDTTGIKPKEYTADDLPPMERMLYDKIQVAMDYGVWEKDEQLEQENIRHLKCLIDKGWTFRDLPEEHQNATIYELYLKALDMWLEEQILAIKTLDNPAAVW